MNAKILGICTAILASGLAVTPLHASTLNDQRAIADMQTGKGIFDITRADPASIAGTLAVINQTVDGLIEQGVTPDLIVAFRGGSVANLAKNPSHLPEKQQAEARKLAEIIQTMAERGVYFEACAIALQRAGVEPEDLLDEVNPVANTYISMIGYQAQGYALISLN